MAKLQILRTTYRSHRVFRDLQLTQALETLLSVSGGAIVVTINQTPRLGDHAAFELTASGAGPLWLPFSCQAWYRQGIEFGLFRLPKSEDGRCKSHDGTFRLTRKSAFASVICRSIVTVNGSNLELEEIRLHAKSLWLA